MEIVLLVSLCFLFISFVISIVWFWASCVYDILPPRLQHRIDGFFKSIKDRIYRAIFGRWVEPEDLSESEEEDKGKNPDRDTPFGY